MHLIASARKTPQTGTESTVLQTNGPETFSEHSVIARKKQIAVVQAVRQGREKLRVKLQLQLIKIGWRRTRRVEVLDAVPKSDRGFPGRFAEFENKNNHSQILHRRESHISCVAAVVVGVERGEKGSRRALVVFKPNA